MPIIKDFGLGQHVGTQWINYAALRSRAATEDRLPGVLLLLLLPVLHGPVPNELGRGDSRGKKSKFTRIYESEKDAV